MLNSITKNRIFVLSQPKNIFTQKYSPHIFNGASSSSSMGCDKNISLDLRHNPLISPSESCTFLPGLAPRTVENNKKENQPTSHARQWADNCDATSLGQFRIGFVSGSATYLLTASIWCCRYSTCHCHSLFWRYNVSVCVLQNCIRYVVVVVCRCRHPTGPTIIYDYIRPVRTERVWAFGGEFARTIMSVVGSRQVGRSKIFVYVIAATKRERRRPGE